MLEVLDDFKPEIADEKRQIEGILKKGEKRILEFEDGEMKTFGKRISCEMPIPHEELDEEQFTIYNKNGFCYIVDNSNEFPTRILAVKGKKYKLQREEFFSVGLAQDLYIHECTSRVQGK